MKPHFIVLTCNSAKDLSPAYKRLLCSNWGDECVTLLYDSNHQAMAEEARSLGWDTEVFDWEEVTSRLSGPGWTKNYTSTKRVVSPARTAAYDVMKKRGIRYFMELDDDFVGVHIPERISHNVRAAKKRLHIGKEPPKFAMDYFREMVEAAFDLAASTGCIVSFVQGGELMSADVSRYHFKPKCMNTFILDSEKPVIGGGINEDVNMYCKRLTEAPRFQLGYIIWNHMGSQLRIGADYKGTWEKTYATVILNPTAIVLATYNNHGADKSVGYNYARIHHAVQYEHTQPKHVYPVEGPDKTKEG